MVLRYRITFPLLNNFLMYFVSFPTASKDGQGQVNKTIRPNLLRDTRDIHWAFSNSVGT